MGTLIILYILFKKQIIKIIQLKLIFFKIKYIDKFAQNKNNVEPRLKTQNNFLTSLFDQIYFCLSKSLSDRPIANNLLRLIPFFLG